MARRYGVRNVGVRSGSKLRKVVRIEWRDDSYGGHYWEILACGHDGHPIGLDGNRASQRWCDECRDEAATDRRAG